MRSSEPVVRSNQSAALVDRFSRAVERARYAEKLSSRAVESVCRAVEQARRTEKAVYSAVK